MKKALMLSTAVMMAAMSSAMAQSVTAARSEAVFAQEQPETQQDPVMDQVRYLQAEWAKIKYQTPEQDAQLSAIHALEDHAAKVTAAYADRPEPKIWEAIILSTDAGIVKGLSALSKVEKAKELLESALQIDPRALDGSAHTSLGSLYYQVPGWPLGFGDNEKAEKHLKMALEINPDGIDPNFFYGDFLLQNDRPSDARSYFEHALQAPDRPDRALADAGRRQEIKAKLAEIDQKRKDSGGSQYN